MKLTDAFDWIGRSFLTAAQASWQAALLALVVFALQALFRRQLSARWRSALWLVVFARLVLPTLPARPPDTQNLLRISEPVLMVAASPFVLEASVSQETLPSAQFPGLFAWVTIERHAVSALGLLWIIGALVLWTGMIILHVRLSRRLSRHTLEFQPTLQILLQNCAGELRLSSRIRLRLSSRIKTPAITGLLQPVIYLPEDFESAFSVEEQRMILLHELAHIRRGDLWINAAATTLMALHWFNPVLWFAYRQLITDRECATDSLVLSGDRAALKHRYGHTLLKLVEGVHRPSPVFPLFVGVVESTQSLRRRILGIHTASVTGYRISATAILLIGVVAMLMVVQAGLRAGDTLPPIVPELPAKATREQTNAYIEAVLAPVSRFANSSLKDPEITQLKKVGPENLDLLIEANANYPQNATVNYYLSMAICDLARPEDRDAVLRALPANRYLVYTVVKRHWAAEAREELLRVFRKEPGTFSPGWIEAIAQLHDPSTYDELKAYLATGPGRSITYEALKNIPDIGDLTGTVKKAWPAAVLKPSYDLPEFAKIAAGYGIEDAATYLREHPAPTEKEATKAMKNAETLTSSLDGSKMSETQASELLQQIGHTPDDLNLRLKILGYYQLARLNDRIAQAAAQPHILYIVEHAPASTAAGQPAISVLKNIDPVHYQEVRTAWLDQVDKNETNAAVLGNAAAFFLINEAGMAESLLLRAQKLEPANPQWPQNLSQLYSLGMIPNAQGKAFAAARIALEMTRDDKIRYFFILTEIPELARRAGDYNAARTYSEKLLNLATAYPKDWNYGNAIYSANSALGLVALHDGDTAAAVRYLEAAGATPGSPQLNSFGPDLTLANDLLKAGQREPVFNFLTAIAKFWKGRQEQMDRWRQAIEKGETPKLSRYTTR